MKKLFFSFRILGVLIFCLPFVANAQTIWLENFDGSNTTNPISSTDICATPFTDDRDYFNVVCIDGGGCPNEINDDFFYFGSTGQFFGARDIDSKPCGTGASEGSFSFQGIDISSCSAVPYLCFTIAESRNVDATVQNEWTGSGGGREDTWDGPDSGSGRPASGIEIGASVDGAGFTPVTAFKNSFVPGSTSRSDQRGKLDLNCSGVGGDAPGEIDITDNFTKYCFELPFNGTSLDLQVDVLGMNAGGEDVALDDFEVHCGTPTSGSVQPACTPYSAIPPVDPTAFKFIEDFDGSNTTNPISYPTGCNYRENSRDYFSIMSIAGSNNMNSNYAYVGATGNFFGVRDMDNGNGCELDETFAFNGINIAGSSATNILYLCVDMAESDAATNNDMSREAGDTWDPNSAVTFNASIDGGATFPIASFAGMPGSGDTGPGIDVDCNGAGNIPTLSHAFETYCFEINGAGNTLDLSVNVANLNTCGEDVAIDNIKILCTTDLADIRTTLSQSCTAPVRAVPTMGEWALFILFLLIANLGALFIMAFQRQPTLATGNQTVSMSSVLRTATFNRANFNKALKHAFGLAIVGFAIIFVGWGEIVSTDFIGMALSIPLVAYFIHLFYDKK